MQPDKTKTDLNPLRCPACKKIPCGCPGGGGGSDPDKTEEEKSEELKKISGFLAGLPPKNEPQLQEEPLNLVEASLNTAPNPGLFLDLNALSPELTPDQEIFASENKEHEEPPALEQSIQEKIDYIPRGVEEIEAIEEQAEEHLALSPFSMEMLNDLRQQKKRSDLEEEDDTAQHEKEASTSLQQDEQPEHAMILALISQGIFENPLSIDGPNEENSSANEEEPVSAGYSRS